MPDNDERDPLEGWLNQQVRPLPPPPGTFELITRRARRRKLRRAAITAVSGSVVAAGALVAATNPTLLHLSPPSESGQVAAGTRPSGTASDKAGTQQPNGTGSPAPSTPSPTSAAGAGGLLSGPVPANFAPSSVTFVSAKRAWVIGQAGTPGSCYNGNICTSVAWTPDGGSTWHGEHAPVAGSPSGPSGVSGIRFLDGVNGWAFGPELWTTHDAGDHWQPVGTSGKRVTDLETAGNRAYALFASCSGTSGARFAADCTSYTLMTTLANADDWTPVGPATTDLTAGGSATSASLQLSGGTGYLVAPDGTLYSGPVGGTWTKAGTASCQPGPAQADGLPANALLATLTQTHLAMACLGSSYGAAQYAIFTSDDGGANWTQSQATLPPNVSPSTLWGTSAGITGTATTGTPTSLTGTTDGTLILATSQAMFVLPGGAPSWTAARAAGSAAGWPSAGLPSGGFSYVGMTTPDRGVAVPSDTSRHEIWVTTDAGHTWTARPIK
jgi:hypothetical protein